MTNSRHDGFMAKRPRDPVQLAKQVFDIAIGEAEDTVSESKRHPSGRQASGKKGGPARAAALTPDQRRIIAQKAAAARWKNATSQQERGKVKREHPKEHSGAPR
jgi:hypothetical protein